MNKSIDILSYLQRLLSNKREERGITIFIAKEYPVLFFSALLRFCMHNLQKYVVRIDLKILSKSDIQKQLQGSFLGLKCVFWFGSLSEISAAEQLWWFNYLSVYQGDHEIFLFTEPQENLYKYHFDMVEFPDTITVDAAISIAAIVRPNVEKERLIYFFKKVIEVTGTLTVDQVCILSAYSTVAGKNSPQFYTEILPNIIQPYQSLFALSDALFEKNKKKFLVLWQPLSEQFSMQFWISYWSDQVWRAYFYVLYMQEGKIAEAKKIAYRLPFSFTQKHWKMYKKESFLKSSQFLYELDYASKNGIIGQEAMLDIFCFDLLA